MIPLNIFLGDDSRMPHVVDVLIHSLRTHSSMQLNIRKLRLAEIERETNFTRPNDVLASTEFTYTRFLVPYLMGYQGTALFIDNDMLALGDIAEIASLDVTDLALRVVKHPPYSPEGIVKMDGRIQTSYPRKNWSSVMLMNCSKLRVWTTDSVSTQTGAWLHRFEPIPDKEIGELPREWNVLDKLPADGRVQGEPVKLLHYTSGGPWFESCRQDTPENRLWLAAERKALHDTAHAGRARLVRDIEEPLSPTLRGSLEKSGEVIGRPFVQATDEEQF